MLAPCKDAYMYLIGIFKPGENHAGACHVCFAGNASYTLISRRFAASLGLIDDHGRPRQNSIQTTTVLGAVAGASEEIPLMKINYELRGMYCQTIANSRSWAPHILLSLFTWPVATTWY